MANGQLKRILRRGSSADDAETELLQIRVLARLQGKWQAVVDEDGSTAPGEPEPEIAAEVAQAPEIAQAPEVDEETAIVQAPDVVQTPDVTRASGVLEAPEIDDDADLVHASGTTEGMDVVKAPLIDEGSEIDGGSVDRRGTRD